MPCINEIDLKGCVVSNRCNSDIAMIICIMHAWVRALTHMLGVKGRELFHKAINYHKLGSGVHMYIQSNIRYKDSRPAPRFNPCNGIINIIGVLGVLLSEF